MSGSLESRVAHMLDTEWRSDGFALTKLSRMIRMMRQLGYAVDCSSLLADMEAWNYENHPVQRAWISAMNNDASAEELNTETEEENAD